MVYWSWCLVSASAVSGGRPRSCRVETVPPSSALGASVLPVWPAGFSSSVLCLSRTAEASRECVRPPGGLRCSSRPCRPRLHSRPLLRSMLSGRPRCLAGGRPPDTESAHGSPRFPPRVSSGRTPPSRPAPGHGLSRSILILSRISALVHRGMRFLAQLPQDVGELCLAQTAQRAATRPQVRYQ